MTRQPHSRVTGGSLTQRPRPTAPRLLGPSCIGAAELELPCPHKGETRKFFSPTHRPNFQFHMLGRNIQEREVEYSQNIHP